uniref:DJ-1/PfpI domain-containing protein n=1 Tax=Arcella intermedia TaxID=1963864 RepID=A0A6B2LIG3_9EUKA
MSGCGVKDGSEIHEVVSTCIGVSMNGAQYKCFAPDIQQSHVVNHSDGTVAEEQRNVLVESARISRGDIQDLSQLSASKFDALIIPGGFGAAKNLSNFAEKGAEFSVLPDLERVMTEFHKAKKPIGLCCISPVLAAKVFPGVSVTIGQDEETSKVISSLNSKNVVKKVEEVEVDKTNLIVTTPAYMENEPIHKIFTGITNMVKNVLVLTKKEEL